MLEYEFCCIEFTIIVANENAHGRASPQQHVSPGAAYMPLVTPVAADIRADTGVGDVGAAAPVPYALAAGFGTDE